MKNIKIDIKTCNFCNKKRSNNTKKFCSLECYRKSLIGSSRQKNGGNPICVGCGNNFYIPKSRIGKRKFCSKECYLKTHSLLKPIFNRECVICKKSYITKYKNSFICKNKICIQTNQIKLNKIRGNRNIVKICSLCRLSFETKLSKQGRKYCDNCIGIVKSNNKKGSNNKAFWMGGISDLNKTNRQRLASTQKYIKFRKKILIRDNYTCVLCGFEGLSNELQLDHILPCKKYPELFFDDNNVRILCEKCHYKTDTYGFKYYTRYLKNL